MPKALKGILAAAAIVLFFVIGFSVYAQFALDYSLESLRNTLQASRRGFDSQSGSQAYQSKLESLLVEELAQKKTDFGNVVLLEHAARSMHEAVDASGYGRARVYLSEILKEKSSQRNWFLRALDAAYYFFQSFVKSFQQFWTYAFKRLQPGFQASPLEGTGVLILGEAEQREKNGQLAEAERLYREFLERYPGRAERGFVRISLAHVLMKMRQLDEAEKILHSVQNEYPGTREEDISTGLLLHTASMRRRLSRLPELENWIRDNPDRIFEERGGLELAVNYIATFQTDRALSVLRKLAEAPDPRVRAKALFYQGLLHKWEGDLEQGREIFESLGEEPGLDENLVAATQAELADVYYKAGDYNKALAHYGQFAKQAPEISLRVLSELEQGDINLFRLGNTEAAQERLERLRREFPNLGPQFKLARQRLEEALKQNVRENGFRALVEGRLDVAAQIFKDHLKKFPQDGRIRSALGSIYLLQGNLKEALEEAEKGYGLYQDEYTASVLGYVYEKIGEAVLAEKYYAIGTAIKPTYVVAKFNLSVMLLMRGAYKKADPLLKELEKQAPEPPSVIQAKVLNNRGCALWGLGEKTEARAYFEKALAVLPDFREARANVKLAGGGTPVQALSETPVSH